MKKRLIASVLVLVFVTVFAVISDGYVDRQLQDMLTLFEKTDSISEQTALESWEELYDKRYFALDKNFIFAIDSALKEHTNIGEDGRKEMAVALIKCYIKSRQPTIANIL